MVFNLFNTLISVGALQGLIVGLWLFPYLTEKRTPKLFLSFLLIGLASILIRVTIVDLSQGANLPQLHLNFIFLITPALYLYIRSLCNKLRYNSLQIFWHFLPFIIINAGYLVLYAIYNTYSQYQTYLLTTISIDESISIVYFTYYLSITYLFIKQNQYELGKAQFGWIKKLLLFFVGFWLAWLGYLIAELFFYHYSMLVTSFYPVMILLSGMLYYMSIQVFILKGTLFESKGRSNRKHRVLAKKDSADLLKELQTIMTNEKPFLDGNLSLTKLSDSLNVNPKMLSFLINEHLGKNFNDYVNDWRIKEIKSRLKDPKFEHLKIVSIAFDCGFNSKSTFNLAFKKSTGLSPTDYKRSLDQLD